ncbi:unnamed protein product [Mycena citricolor]|uniref:Uncharacterized protein n=1 Tax=Mycena citricolor TaxID=2018698 RepID=A0AAD2K540_9AGAR|nr:unnamed protein product [Mycena citricolor]
MLLCVLPSPSRGAGRQTLIHTTGCCSSSDPGSDGSGLCASTSVFPCLSSSARNRDPREAALEREFLERGYRKDPGSGRITTARKDSDQAEKAGGTGAVSDPPGRIEGLPRVGAGGVAGDGNSAGINS